MSFLQLDLQLGTYLPSAYGTFRLFGESPEDFETVIGHYFPQHLEPGKRIDHSREIKEIKKFNLDGHFADESQENPDWIRMEISKNLTLTTKLDDLGSVMDYIRTADFQHQKRGNLYKWNPIDVENGRKLLAFVPERVLNELVNCDYSRFAQVVDELRAQRRPAESRIYMGSSAGWDWIDPLE
ncbi:hypothetical protein HOA92_04635 [archaeon]|jgi:hypothetical protein|nr:hypothetical protein [archaeon]MBT6762303.1 hypothetical protein [archaeon]